MHGGPALFTREPRRSRSFFPDGRTGVRGRAGTTGRRAADSRHHRQPRDTLDGPFAGRVVEARARHFHGDARPKGPGGGLLLRLRPEPLSGASSPGGSDHACLDGASRTAAAVPPKQRALFMRRWLAAETGESPSAVQAACWIDLKRKYLELRPNLRRVYLARAGPVALCRGGAAAGFSASDGRRLRSAISKATSRRCWTSDLHRWTAGWPGSWRRN